MSLYSRHVLPWICHWMRNKVLRPFRSRFAGCAEGRVLEIGIGSKLNLPHYSVARCVIGIEPSRELLRMARRKPKWTAVPYELVEGSAEFLPFDNASMDVAAASRRRASPHQVAHRFMTGIRNPNFSEFAGAVQPRQHYSIAPVRFDPVSRFHRDQRRHHHRTGVTKPGQEMKSSEKQTSLS
jgi:hypothetical protein